LLITKAAEECHEKCLLSYNKTHDKVVQWTLLPRVLLHGQSDRSEEDEARVATQLVHKAISEALTNQNQILVNSIGNTMKVVFYGAPIDQVRLAYYNSQNPSAMGSNIPSSSQPLNGG
jgi:hypothetical protein